MVVVPALAKCEEGEQQAVPAVITRLEAFFSEAMREGINRASGMEQDRGADEKSPDDHLPWRGCKSRCKSFQRSSEAVETNE